jgi:hypothetical protein
MSTKDEKNKLQRKRYKNTGHAVLIPQYKLTQYKHVYTIYQIHTHNTPSLLEYPQFLQLDTFILHFTATSLTSYQSVSYALHVNMYNNKILKYSISRKYWVSGLWSTAGIRKIRKLVVSETGAVSIFKWNLLCWVP